MNKITVDELEKSLLIEIIATTASDFISIDEETFSDFYEFYNNYLNELDIEKIKRIGMMLLKN